MKSQQLLSKVALALLIIAPMLIITLHPDLLTALLTTSLFTVVIAMLLAVVLQHTERKDIVGGTAAYAAVLVVFVSVLVAKTLDKDRAAHQARLTRLSATGRLLQLLLPSQVVLRLFLYQHYCCGVFVWKARSIISK